MLCWYFFLLTTPSVFPQFVEKVWKFFCYNINIELPFGVFFDIMLVTNPQCSCSPASPVIPTGALALASKVPAHDQGNGFLRLWGNLCMRCVPLHPPEALVSHLAACFPHPRAYLKTKKSPNFPQATDRYKAKSAGILGGFRAVLTQ